MTPHLPPHISHPTFPLYRYIRFIYNRVVLENATVRASAVSALAKFGIQNDYLRTSIIVLLQRCLHDNDDEVRDRATFFVALLKSMDQPGGLGGLEPKELVMDKLSVPLLALEACCRDYMQAPNPNPNPNPNPSPNPNPNPSPNPNPNPNPSPNQARNLGQLAAYFLQTGAMREAADFYLQATP